MSRIYLALTIGLILFSATALFAGVRTWTDRDGRTVEAEFVRVYDGMVVLRQGPRFVKIPLENFSEEDQEFIRDGGKEEGDIQKAPQAIDRPAEPPRRTWTDRNGNQLEASFVRLHQNQIVLSASGRVKTFAIEEFSDEDQAYVKEWLIDSGEQAQADAMDSYLAARRQAEERARLGPRSSTNGNSGGSFSPNASPGDQVAEAMRQSQEQWAQAEAARQQTFDRIQQQQRAVHEQIERQRQETVAEMQRQADERNRQAIERAAEANRQWQESFARMEGVEMHYKMCMKCRKQVPESSRPGQRCPHCKVYWKAYMDENGKTEYASGSDSSDEGDSYAGGIGLLAALIGLVAVSIRWFLS